MPAVVILRRLACLILFCCSSAAFPAPVDELAAALGGVEHLQGEFRQRQYDEGGALLGESSGTFRLLRPGYFAWEIRAPDNQLIVADPQYLWHHDRDLETVTRRPVGTGSASAPLQVLGGDATTLAEAFDITRGEQDSYILTPRSGEAGFERLELWLEGALPRRMEIRDNLHQRVSIEFSELDRETPLTPGDFSFEPPPDADLFTYDE